MCTVPSTADRNFVRLSMRKGRQRREDRGRDVDRFAGTPKTGSLSGSPAEDEGLVGNPTFRKSSRSASPELLTGPTTETCFQTRHTGTPRRIEQLASLHRGFRGNHLLKLRTDERMVSIPRSAELSALAREHCPPGWHRAGSEGHRGDWGKWFQAGVLPVAVLVTSPAQ